jgi:hypothetical protein
MSELPERLSPGQRLSAHWLNRLLDYLRARELRPGPGVHLTRTPSGTTIGTTRGPAAAAAAADDGCYPAVINNESTIPGIYKATLYKDGLGTGSGTAIDLVLTEFGQEMGLPPGTIVLAHPICVLAGEDGRRT